VIRVHIWYGEDGRIVAVGRAQSSTVCLPSAGDGQRVVQLEVEESAIATLAETHLVSQSGDALVLRKR
jgi:hypothetical protein